MTEKGWLRSTSPQPMLEFLWSAPTDRQLRLFGCACARRVWDFLVDKRSQEAVESAEHFADGDIDTNLLARAYITALDALEEMDPESGCNATLVTAARTAVDVARPSAEFRLLPGIRDSSVTTRVAEGAALTVALAAQTVGKGLLRVRKAEERALAKVMRDLFGSSFRAMRFLRGWRTDTALSLARTMYESHDFSAMPILADALQDAGCDNSDILNHCRDSKQIHVRGCWVVDLVLGK